MKDIQKAFKLPLSSYSKRDLEELKENTAFHKKNYQKKVNLMKSAAKNLGNNSKQKALKNKYKQL